MTLPRRSAISHQSQALPVVSVTDLRPVRVAVVEERHQRPGVSVSTNPPRTMAGSFAWGCVPVNQGGADPIPASPRYPSESNGPEPSSSVLWGRMAWSASSSLERNCGPGIPFGPGPDGVGSPSGRSQGVRLEARRSFLDVRTPKAVGRKALLAQATEAVIAVCLPAPSWPIQRTRVSSVDEASWPEDQSHAGDPHRGRRSLG